MARPRNFDTDQALDAILDAFWRHGFADTSIQTLCDATGLRPASLYAAFGNKDDMFHTAASRYLAWLGLELNSERSGLDAIRYAMDRVVELTIADPERRGCPLLNSIAEMHCLERRSQDLIRNSLQMMKGFYEEHLALIVRGRSRQARRQELVAELLAASVSIRVLGRAGEPEDVLRGIARGAVKRVRAEVDSR